jgi:hypothetical protein
VDIIDLIELEANFLKINKIKKEFFIKSANDKIISQKIEENFEFNDKD